MEGAVFMTYTAASHQVAIELFCMHSQGADMSVNMQLPLVL